MDGKERLFLLDMKVFQRFSYTWKFPFSITFGDKEMQDFICSPGVTGRIYLKYRVLR